MTPPSHLHSPSFYDCAPVQADRRQFTNCASPAHTGTSTVPQLLRSNPSHNVDYWRAFALPYTATHTGTFKATPRTKPMPPPPHHIFTFSGYMQLWTFELVRSTYAIYGNVFRTQICNTLKRNRRRRCWRPPAGNIVGALYIPEAVTQSLVFLKMSKIIARNMLDWLELLISRYCCI